MSAFPTNKAFWSFMKGATAFNVWIYRCTGGKLGGKIKGASVLLLNHVGRKSGKARTTPLLYIKDGSDFVIVASKGGNPKNPAWWLNIRDAGQATIEVGRDRIPVSVRQASAEEKGRLWPKLVAAYSGYQDYQEATEREIPVAVLSPS